MATKRSTFQKRQRENDLKDKARAKEARRAAKRVADKLPKVDPPADDTPLLDENGQPVVIPTVTAAGGTQ